MKRKYRIIAEGDQVRVLEKEYDSVFYRVEVKNETGQWRLWGAVLQTTFAKLVNAIQGTGFHVKRKPTEG